MPTGIGEAIRRANRPRKPEESLTLRLAVLGAVMTSATALVAEAAIGIGTYVIVAVLIPVAYWVSYVRRDKDNWHIKVALAIAAVIALIRFMGQLRGIGALDEIRFPLADLFLMVQVIHSFDLPARKDLNFSLGSSLTLMAVAASISQTMVYAIFLLIYFAFAVAALALAHRSELEEGAAATMTPAGAGPKRERRLPVREIGRALAVSALAATTLFMVIPQTSNLPSFALPFSLGSGFGLASGGGLFNPGFGSSASTRAGGALYYGFADTMDLRVRGELPDDLVMRVRSSAPAMWKGTAFDQYDGAIWSKDTSSEPVPLFGPPFTYPPEHRSLGPRAEVIQTFYVEVEMPSAVLAAGQPDSVWFDGPVRIDELGSLTTDSTLTEGTVYSVISTRGVSDPADLREHSASEFGVPPNIERYLQLPDDLPARVHNLARSITENADNDFDRVKAIERYLADNFRYDIDSPVPPEGQDAVDHFLFETDVGFCEQFASATAVMLRSLGIPTRVVVGYTPGNRNPFTGYHEVKASDAHSWVEVWFPARGWYEFDPTFAIPAAEPDISDSVPLAKVISWVADKVKRLLPEGLGDWVRYTLIACLVAAFTWGGWMAWRRLRPGKRPLFLPRGEVAGDGPVVRAFGRLERRMAMVGRARKPSETAAEVIDRTADLEHDPTRAALSALERERYGPAPPPGEQADAAIEEIDRLVPVEDSRQ